MTSSTSQNRQSTVEMPAPTGWPVLFAFGVALLFAGLVTTGMVSLVGVILQVCAAVGWWYNVLPAERHELLTVDPDPEIAAAQPVRPVEHLRAGFEGHRMQLPLEIKPYSAGIKGGVVGAVAMAGVAMLFGLISQGSVWYPINLLAAAAVPDLAAASVEQLRQFSPIGLVLGVLIHGLTSILVGVLYAVMLPMFPKSAFWWAGVSSPVLWSGLIASTLAMVNPALNARIDWRWFVASQLAFGLTGGYVIARSQSIHILQHLPLAVRAGIEAPGINLHGENPQDPGRS